MNSYSHSGTSVSPNKGVYQLGHSYGALCSLEAALLVTNINKLILYEPAISEGAPIYPPDARDRIPALINSGDREGVSLAFYREIVGVPEHEIDLTFGPL